MIKPYRCVIASRSKASSLLNLPSTRFSIRTQANKMCTPTLPHRSLTALSKDSTEPSLPMVRLPLERPTRWKERWEKVLPPNQASSPAWSGTYLTPFPKHTRTSNSGLRSLLPSSTWKNSETCLTKIRLISRLGPTKNEESLLKTLLKNTSPHPMKFISWSKSPGTQGQSPPRT